MCICCACSSVEEPAAKVIKTNKSEIQNYYDIIHQLSDNLGGILIPKSKPKSVVVAIL